MKKTIKINLLTLLIILLTFFVAACGNNKDANNKKEDTDVTESDSADAEAEAEAEGDGDTVSEDVIYTPEAGMTLEMPKSYTENSDKVFIYYDGYEITEGVLATFIYVYPDSYANLLTMSDEDFEKIESTVINPLNIFKVNSEAWTEDKLATWLLNQGYAEDLALELFEEGDGYAVYFDNHPEIPEGVSEEVAAVYSGIIEELDVAKKNIIFSEPEDYSKVGQGETLSFKTTDLDGNEVSSEDLFSKNKYTVVNFWTSWCGPCIQEMPELEEMNKELAAKGCGIIGVLCDGNEASGLADGKEVVADTGVTYPIVIPWDGWDEIITLQGYPTTFFVDSNGVIVGEAIIGAAPELYMTQIDALLG